MRDVFEWINSESTPKKAFHSGGVLGYSDVDKMAGLTFELLTGTSAQINTTLSSYASFINSAVEEANKALK